MFHKATFVPAQQLLTQSLVRKLRLQTLPEARQETSVSVTLLHSIKPSHQQSAARRRAL